MKILFVDHASHLKTHSADFFLDILRESFDVDVFYYEKTYDFTIPKEKINNSDVVIFWEFLYNRHNLGIPGKRCVFVPMYDNEWGSKWQWKRIAASGMPVISFCDAITRHAKSQGVKHILDVRFALDPAKFENMTGNPRKAALWDRGQISPEHVARLFAPGTIDSLTIFRRPEEGISYKSVKTNGLPFKVEIKESAFLPPDEHHALQKGFGIYIAPRWKEGIGMAFLEQLAMGKCVIAHDDATMNEYIEDGKTGILRNFKRSIRPVSSADIDIVRKNVLNSSRQAYARWLSDKKNIIPFIKSISTLPPLSVNSFREKMHYALFMLEGLLHRLTECLGG